MKKLFLYISLLFTILLVGCELDTEIIDDRADEVIITPESVASILFDPNQTQTIELSAIVENNFNNVIPNAEIEWTSSDESILSVEQGLVTIHSPNTNNFIVASYPEASPDTIRITINESEEEVSTVTISLPADVPPVLEVGDSVQLTFDAVNINGGAAETEITWESSAPSIVTVNQEGWVKGVSEGTARITATADNGAMSEPITFTIGTAEQTTRTGMFSGLNNYTVAGTVTLSINGSGQLEVVFGDDFQAQNGPGLFVFLTNDRDNPTSGIELESLQSTSGAQTYLVDNVGLSEYQFIVIHCKPFNIPFGFAEFN